MIHKCETLQRIISKRVLRVNEKEYGTVSKSLMCQIEEFMKPEFLIDEFPSSSDVESIELRTVEHEPIADEPAKSDSEALANAALGLLASISHAITDDYDWEHKKHSSKVDKKLRRTIDRKNWK